MLPTESVSGCSRQFGTMQHSVEVPKYRRNEPVAALQHTDSNVQNYFWTLHGRSTSEGKNRQGRPGRSIGRKFSARSKKWHTMYNAGQKTSTSERNSGNGGGDSPERTALPARFPAIRNQYRDFSGLCRKYPLHGPSILMNSGHFSRPSRLDPTEQGIYFDYLGIKIPYLGKLRSISKLRNP
jgi:hypothetical protein